MAALAMAAGASAASINVLWYTAGTTDGGNFATYQAGVTNLASQAPSAPGGNNWTVTFWTGGAMPTGNYNVLVVASPEFDDGGDYSGLNSAAFSLGNRIMLTGQDADWHYMNYPGATAFNGPQGFLLDAINWAGSGTGMGAVLLQPESYTLGLTGLGTTGGGSNSVLIPSAYASYPINTNLTSAGLSNWSTSAHESWSGFNTSSWTGINQSGDDASQYITIVSAATAEGGVSGSAPEPTTLLTLGGGLLGLGMWHRRRSAS